jgi:hypothetical protein
MKRVITLSAIAALTMSGTSMTAWGQDAINQPGQAAQNAGQEVRQAGQAAQRGAQDLKQDIQRQFSETAATVEADAKSEDLREVVGELVSATLKGDKLDDAVERLSKQNRDKIGDISDDDARTVRAEAERLRDAFKQRYDKELDIDNDKLFEDADYVQLEVKNADQIARFPLNASGTDAAGEAQLAAAQNDSASTFDVKEGDKIAVLAISGDHKDAKAKTDMQQPGAATSGKHDALKLSAVQEDDDWHLALPTSVDKRTLTQNLTTRMRDLTAAQNQWPDDADKAQTLIAKKVLMAYYDVDDRGSDNRQQPGQMNQGGQAQPQSVTPPANR